MSMTELEKQVFDTQIQLATAMAEYLPYLKYLPEISKALSHLDYDSLRNSKLLEVMLLRQFGAPINTQNLTALTNFMVNLNKKAA